MPGATRVARPEIALFEDRYLHSGTRQTVVGREHSRKQMLNSLLANGASGMSDIEGKVAREAMNECGQRVSFKSFGVQTGPDFSA
jgi:hypothetical protein